MKKLLIIVLIVILTGCSKNKVHINTIVVENDNSLVNISYPITNTDLDLIIKKDIDEIYNDYKSFKEINIDYLYYKIDNMISVALFIYIYDNKAINYVKTYYYKDRLLTIDDFVDRDKLNKILINKIKDLDIPIGTINSHLEFSFDTNYLTIYIENKEIKILLKDLDIFFKKEELVYYPEVTNDNDVSVDDKVVALTFDDGPSIYTDRIIEYLHDNDCVGTFFVLGNKVNDYKDVIIKSINYGNEIGNHSYNHKWLIKLKKEEVKEQVEKTQNIIKEKTGYVPVLLRPTYGSVNSTLKEITDLEIALWNVDTLDWKYRSTDKIVSRATKNLKDGNIILMHDIYKRSFNALKKIVPIIKEKGYKCVTISELNEIKKLRKYE